MSGFLNCLTYLAIVSFSSFLIGRILPKEFFRYDSFLFRPFRFEERGRIYDALHVRKWKDKLPDMSLVFPGMLPSKKPPRKITITQMETMLQETCIAEWIHGLLCLIGCGCIYIWRCTGGWIVSLLFALGNLPYIIIQRYNRPKLIHLFLKLKNSEYADARRREIHGESSYT